MTGGGGGSRLVAGWLAGVLMSAGAWAAASAGWFNIDRSRAVLTVEDTAQPDINLELRVQLEGGSFSEWGAAVDLSELASTSAALGINLELRATPSSANDGTDAVYAISIADGVGLDWRNDLYRFGGCKQAASYEIGNREPDYHP